MCLPRVSLIPVEYSCGDTNSGPQEVIYFQNRNFPESATDREFCRFTVQIKDDSICQLRSPIATESDDS